MLYGFLMQLEPTEKNKTIEALLFAATGSVCADWTPEDIKILSDVAVKLKNSLAAEELKLTSIYVFNEFEDKNDEYILDAFKESIEVKKFEE